MRASELRDLSDQELDLKERELKEDLFRLRLRHGTAQLENTEKLVLVRRDIARILTIREERAAGARKTD
jgi:large subunit ribosomal protein L29